MPVLSAEGVTKRFGGVVALHDADFSCEPGEIHALLGENGAGKSTMVKVLCGVQPADAGTITLHGEHVTYSGPAAAANAGIIPVFQELSLIPHLTVDENLFMGREPRNRFGLIDSRAMRRQVRMLLADLRFPNIDPGATVGDLPLAERQLVEITKAISRNPDVLILDEATSALGKQEVEQVFAVLRALRERGMAIVFISHRMEEVRALCDRATVFRDGQHVGTIVVREARGDEIIRMMIGRTLREVFPAKPPRPAQETPLLEVNGLGWGTALRDTTFTLNRGEILGLSGLEGQGQGDLLLALFGVYAGTNGTVAFQGRPVKLTGPGRTMESGIALIPEDRKTQGLILPLSVRENVTLPTLGERARLGIINPVAERRATLTAVDQLSIRTSSSETPVRYLSGGNQQKVAISKWLLTDARAFLMYDPTRGIDVGTKQEIYRLIRGLADQGHGILFFSTDLTEIVGLCDRALVMFEGAIVRELVGPELTEANLVSAAVGMTVSEAEVVA
ncbi:MAG: sugar ABC transporter ATP-binding protein [Thermomicrobiales bacterium]